MKRSIRNYSIFFFLIFFLDRITKYGAVHGVFDSWGIDPYFQIELTINRGFSWSILASDVWIVSFFVGIVTTIITGFLIQYLIQNWQDPKKNVIGATMVIAGSCSNIIDRIIYGGVIDFILLSYKNFYWPVFNIADIFIVVGIFLLFIEGYKEE